MFNFFRKKTQPLTTKQVQKALPVSGGLMGHMDQIKELEGSFKKGGRVKKTGAYKLHKGEYVLTKQKALDRKKQ